MTEGIRFQAENAPPFVRSLLRDVFDQRPLYVNGRWDIFFFGCVCRRDGDIGKAAFQVRLRDHRNHVLEKIRGTYGVHLEMDDLLNGSGHLGGLADHVERLYLTSEARRQKAVKAEESARLSRLQGALDRLSRLGIVRVMPSGDVDPNWADRIYREAEAEGSPPRFPDPPRAFPGLRSG
jgi:hypothetical protein